MAGWLKKNKWKVIVPVLLVLVLAGVFWYGGSAPGLQGWTADRNGALQGEPSPAASPSPAGTQRPEPSPAGAGASVTDWSAASGDGDPSGETPPGETDLPPEPPAASDPEPSGPESSPQPGDTAGDREYSESQGMVIDPATGKDAYMTDPVPEGKPLPVNPEDAVLSDTAYTCTISISCATILDHMDWLDPEKTELVPEDGWILPATQVTFYEGESVFNVLQRTCKQNKIHMEFSNTPMYNSAYIEGIHNLYELDCGELSGWMYKVNEWFPNYGCSRYQLQDGDVICWEYTCDMGVDVGGSNSIGS